MLIIIGRQYIELALLSGRIRLPFTTIELAEIQNKVIIYSPQFFNKGRKHFPFQICFVLYHMWVNQIKPQHAPDSISLKIIRKLGLALFILFGLRETKAQNVNWLQKITYRYWCQPFLHGIISRWHVSSRCALGDHWTNSCNVASYFP